MSRLPRGRVVVALDAAVDHAASEISLLFHHVQNPDTAMRALEAAARHMQRSLPFIRNSQMFAVSVQGMRRTEHGPLVELGVYDESAVPEALTHLAKRLEAGGWNGELVPVDSDWAWGQPTWEPNAPAPATHAVGPRPDRHPARPSLVQGRVVVDTDGMVEHWFGDVDSNDPGYVLLITTSDAGLAANELERAAQRATGIVDAPHPGWAPGIAPGDVEPGTEGPRLRMSIVDEERALVLWAEETARELEARGIEGVLTWG